MSNKVKLTLAGIDGNAFYLLGAFKEAARRQKFSKEYIDSVIEECMSSDYNHLLRTLVKHTEPED